MFEGMKSFFGFNFRSSDKVNNIKNIKNIKNINKSNDPFDTIPNPKCEHLNILDINQTYYFAEDPRKIQNCNSLCRHDSNNYKHKTIVKCMKAKCKNCNYNEVIAVTKNMVICCRDISNNYMEADTKIILEGEWFKVTEAGCDHYDSLLDKKKLKIEYITPLEYEYKKELNEYQEKEAANILFGKNHNEAARLLFGSNEKYMKPIDKPKLKYKAFTHIKCIKCNKADVMLEANCWKEFENGKVVNKCGEWNYSNPYLYYF